MAGIQYELAVLKRRQGDLPAAKELCEKVLTKLQELYGEGHIKTSLPLHELGVITLVLLRSFMPA